MIKKARAGQTRYAPGETKEAQHAAACRSQAPTKPIPTAPTHPPTLARASSLARAAALSISADILTFAILLASLCRYSSVSAVRAVQAVHQGGAY